MLLFSEHINHANQGPPVIYNTISSPILQYKYMKSLIFITYFFYFRIQEFVHSHHTDQNSSICDIRADRSPLLPIRIEKWHRFVHSQMVQRWRRVLPISTQGLCPQESKAHFSKTWSQGRFRELQSEYYLYYLEREVWLGKKYTLLGPDSLRLLWKIATFVKLFFSKQILQLYLSLVGFGPHHLLPSIQYYSRL